MQPVSMTIVPEIKQSSEPKSHVIPSPIINKTYGRYFCMMLSYLLYQHPGFMLLFYDLYATLSVSAMICVRVVTQKPEIS
jgi:hypothetical protein